MTSRGADGSSGAGKLSSPSTTSLSDYAPGLIVLVPADGPALRPVTIESLLPTKFQRPVLQ